jgi:hypothetical protein
MQLVSGCNERTIRVQNGTNMPLVIGKLANVDFAEDSHISLLRSIAYSDANQEHIKYLTL